jgi:DNA-binding NtrC family response regulator
MATILLVEDQVGIRSALGRVLQRVGHAVIEARDGGEALRVLQSQKVDLVITDINMPGMDGIELILALTERWSGLPVIAISGGGLIPKESLLADAMTLGVVTTLEKPVDVATFQAAVREVLERRRPSKPDATGS